MSSRSNIRFDSFLEDLFGLNIRAAKTVWCTFIRPKDYYLAADDPHWQDRYTPSIRLYFSLIAVTMFFRFFWGDPDSATMQSYELQLAAIADQLPQGTDITALAESLASNTFLVLPFALLLCYSALAVIYPFWGRKTSIVQRIRYVFATVIPSNLFNLFAILSFGFVSVSVAMMISVGSIFVALVLDTTTALRGAFHTRSLWGRLWRSVLLSLAILIAGIIGLLITQTVAFRLSLEVIGGL